MKKVQQIRKNNSSISPELTTLLLAYLINKDKEFVHTHPNHRLSWLQRLCFYYYSKKIENNYPLAYISKNKEFYGLNFFVNKNVLVPRPDTEIMVDETIKKIKKDSILIDVGTGSGCIAISIVKNISFRIKTIAIDISSKALCVAKNNSRKHKTNIQFFQGNLLKPVINNPRLLKKKKVIFITANLPYLSIKQYNKEHSIKHEPKNALVATNIGLEFYIKMLQQVKQIKQIANLPISIFMEIDPQQKNLIQNIIAKNFSKAKVEIKKDLAQRDRLVILTI